MNWKELYFGKMNKHEVLSAVADDDWQRVRISMKNTSLEYKYAQLCKWLKLNNYSRKAQVQVTNYVTALSRGGLIKPIDYLF